LGGLAPDRLKLASGLFNLMRNLGGAIGIAACGTFLNDRVNLHFLRMAEHLTTANPAVVALTQRVAGLQTAGGNGDAVHGQSAALQMLWTLTLREAQTMTCADIFLALTLCFVTATIMVPLMRKVGPPKAPSADAH
jgi:DHA2 family multidrug resistance protein